MKTRTLFIIVSLLLCAFAPAKENKNEGSQPVIASQVSVVCTSELQGLAKEWSREYQEQHPGEIIVVDVATGSQMIPSNGQLAFISRNELTKESEWKMVIGRQIIVPVINSSNPFGYLMFENGVSQKRFRALFLQQEKPFWGTILGNGEKNPVNLIILNDPSIMDAIKEFLQIDALPGHVQVVEDQNELLSALQRDQNALGFCSLEGIMDPTGRQVVDRLKILPIDKNDNGKLDYIENIHSDQETFSRGVWIGKYPRSLVNDIYVVSTTQPAEKAQIDFLSWILTKGQNSLVAFGFTDLVYSEVQSKLDGIELAVSETHAADNTVSFPKLILFIVAAILFIGILISSIFGLKREETGSDQSETASPDPSFDERTINAPAGLFYDKSHTWAFMEKDGTVKVGIDDFMQHVTGPFTRVEMMKPGEKVKKGDAFLTLVQKGKQLKLYAPVSGTIIDSNRTLEHNPYFLKSSPYTEGWVYSLEPSGWLQEIPLLSMAGKYRRWLSDEFTRLKDFLATSLQSHKLEYAHVVLQDGGELKNNLLEELGPEVWEDFQSKFIDACE